MCDSYNLEELANKADKIELAHVPFVVIQMKAVEKWKKEKGDVPKNIAQKEEFRQMLKQMALCLPVEDRDNFDEALKDARYCW